AFGGPEDLKKAGGKRALEHEEEGLTQHDAFGGPEDLKKAGGKQTLEHEEGGIAQHALYAGPEAIPPEKRTLPHRELAQHDLFAGPEGVREHEALFPGARKAGIVTTGVPPGMKPGLRRAYAAIILGEIADPRAEGILTRSLTDSDPAVRRAAEDGLARFWERRGMATPVPPAPR
ncbi:MAG TPA: HEAT repeat domain-containing protein, partial [Methanoculleus sp.]|nr:HEAT repeat domain-containing protein [Methanoculleus sp.]